jgi:hypothetical protein
MVLIVCLLPHLPTWTSFTLIHQALNVKNKLTYQPKQPLH